MRRAVPAFLALILALCPLAVRAEFLDPDFSALQIEAIAPPDWIAGPRDGTYIGMCVTCEGTMMLQVDVLDDDGTGERVRSGETTTEIYTALGNANAERIGGAAAYFGTEPLSFASAVGFKTRATIATGDFVVTHQLWSDGKQLVVKVYGGDKRTVDDLAEIVYRAAAPLTFR